MDRLAKQIIGALKYCLAVSLVNPFIANAEFSGTLNFTTNYTWRGYSKSDGDPAVQANLDYEHESGLYLGTWASTIDFGDNGFKDRSRVEVIPYLGWTHKLSDDWRVDVQWSRYLYDGKIFNNSSDYNEFYLLLHFRDLVTTSISFSEDFYNEDQFAATYEVSGRVPITDSIQLSTVLGYSQVSQTLEYDYLYWDLGFSWFHKYGGLDLRYAHGNRVGKTEDRRQIEFETLSPTVVFSIFFGF